MKIEITAVAFGNAKNRFASPDEIARTSVEFIGADFGPGTLDTLAQIVAEQLHTLLQNKKEEKVAHEQDTAVAEYPKDVTPL